MAKVVKKKTTKKVETKKEEKMICLTEKRAVIMALEVSTVYGILLSWAIASFLVEMNFFEISVSTSTVMWLFFPVIMVIIYLILLTYGLMCLSISKQK